MCLCVNLYKEINRSVSGQRWLSIKRIKRDMRTFCVCVCTVSPVFYNKKGQNILLLKLVKFHLSFHVKWHNTTDDPGYFYWVSDMCQIFCQILPPSWLLRRSTGRSCHPWHTPAEALSPTCTHVAELGAERGWFQLSELQCFPKQCSGSSRWTFFLQWSFVQIFYLV